MSKNDSLGQAVGGKLSIELNGVPCRIRPISMGDLGDMEKWSLGERIKVFREASEGMDEKLRMLTMSQMTQEKTDEDSMNQAFQSIAGIRKLISMVGEREDGKEFVVDELIDANNMQEIASILAGFSGLEVEGDENSPPDPAPLKP